MIILIGYHPIVHVAEYLTMAHSAIQQVCFLQENYMSIGQQKYMYNTSIKNNFWLPRTTFPNLYRSYSCRVCLTLYEKYFGNKMLLSLFGFF